MIKLDSTQNFTFLIHLEVLYKSSWPGGVGGWWDYSDNKIGCFNDPAWEKVCGWVACVLADTNYLYTAHWGWINNLILILE